MIEKRLAVVVRVPVCRFYYYLREANAIFCYLYINLSTQLSILVFVIYSAMLIHQPVCISPCDCAGWAGQRLVSGSGGPGLVARAVDFPLTNFHKIKYKAMTQIMATQLTTESLTPRSLLLVASGAPFFLPFSG